MADTNTGNRDDVTNLPHMSQAYDPRTAAKDAPGTPAGESDFLTKQAEDARQAIGAVAAEIGRSLGKGVDPRLWAQHYPWATVAAAAAAGFVAAVATVPSKEDQALKRLAKIEKALGVGPYGNGHGQHHDDGEDAGAKKFAKGQTSFLGGLGHQLLEAVKPALMSALTAGITAKAAAPGAEEMHAAAAGASGHPAPPPDGGKSEGYSPGMDPSNNI